MIAMEDSPVEKVELDDWRVGGLVDDFRIGGFPFDRLVFVVGTEPGTHVAGEGVDCLEGIGGDRLDDLGRDFCSL